jgi:antibiotic biosynthesis monooxygenase (ABM) superfamily enzyme
MKSQILSEQEDWFENAADSVPRVSRKPARTASRWTLLIVSLTVWALALLRIIIGPDIALQSYPLYICIIAVCAVGVLTSW